MKTVVATAVLLTTVFIYSCKKKEEVEPKPAIADMPLIALDMMILGDSIPTDLASPLTSLILKGDYTWVIDLGGTTSFGYYSWVPTEPNTARLRFYVSEWRHLASDSAKSAKLKNILLDVDKCEFPDPAIVDGVFFSTGNWSTYLRTQRQ